MFLKDLLLCISVGSRCDIVMQGKDGGFLHIVGLSSTEDLKDWLDCFVGRVSVTAENSFTVVLVNDEV